MFSILLHLGLAEIWMIFLVQPLMYCIRSSDVRYVSIYQNIDIFIQYRDTVSYRDIFVSNTEYYYLVVSHIHNKKCMLHIIITMLFVTGSLLCY